MDEVIGYLVVIGFITFLTFELIRQIREFKVSKEETRKKSIMIISLFGFVLFFSLNLLIASGSIAANQLITSNSTVLGVFMCLAVHMFVKSRPNPMKKKTSGLGLSKRMLR